MYVYRCTHDILCCVIIFCEPTRIWWFYCEFRKVMKVRNCCSCHNFLIGITLEEESILARFFIPKEAEVYRLPNWNYSRQRIEVCTSSYRGITTKLILKLETPYMCKKRLMTSGAKVRKHIYFTRRRTWLSLIQQ